MLLPIVLLFSFQFGLSWPSSLVFLIGVSGWFVIAPKLFDAQMRRNAMQQMRESSYAKSFGRYTLHVSDANLVSDGPAGHANYNWNSVDRVVLSDDHLFVFLSGPMGYAIRIADVGGEVALRAYNVIQQHIAASK